MQFSGSIAVMRCCHTLYRMPLRSRDIASEMTAHPVQQLKFSSGTREQKEDNQDRIL